jgi:hypothetical protein
MKLQTMEFFSAQELQSVLPYVDYLQVTTYDYGMSQPRYVVHVCLCVCLCVCVYVHML